LCLGTVTDFPLKNFSSGPDKWGGLKNSIIYHFKCLKRTNNTWNNFLPIFFCDNGLSLYMEGGGRIFDYINPFDFHVYMQPTSSETESFQESLYAYI
jgi:hypothetical protein